MTFHLHEKLDKVQNLLHEIAGQKRITEEELLIIKNYVEEQSATIHVLEEGFKIKEELSQPQHPLDENILNYKQEVSEVIARLSSDLREKHLNILQLEDKLTHLGLDIVHLETSKYKELDDLNQQWQEKLKDTESHTERTIQEIVKKHCEDKKNYDIVILGLKEQIAQKEAEVAWCQVVLNEKESKINKEIESLKKELEVTTLKNQELLQQRLLEAENRANKMTQKCLRLQHRYEQKMSLLRNEKDLQVNTFKRQLTCQTEKYVVNKITLENVVKEMELRYRKIITSYLATSQQ